MNKGYKLEASKHGCVLKQNGLVCLTGSMHNELLLLNIKVCVPKEAAYVATLPITTLEGGICDVSVKTPEELCEEKLLIQVPHENVPEGSNTESYGDVEQISNDAEDSTCLDNQISLSQWERKPPAWLSYYVVLALSCNDCDPISFQAAMKSPLSDKWKEACDEKMTALKDSGTWELVEKPSGVKLINNRWVFRTQLNTDGSVARLVAKGYTQKSGIDYDELFSPVARFDTIRSILAVAVSENLSLMQFDVKTAFLYGHLQEEVYMKQPEGYHDGSDRVCKLKRSLYGLKQSPRCWNTRFVSFMKSSVFKSSEADPCLFLRVRNGRKLLVVIYVDDGIIAGSSDEEIKSFTKTLCNKFSVTIGPLNNFLGISVQR